MPDPVTPVARRRTVPAVRGRTLRKSVLLRSVPRHGCCGRTAAARGHLPAAGWFARSARGETPSRRATTEKLLVIVNRDEKLKGAKIDAAGIGHLCNSCNSVFCIIPFIASARCFILSRLLYRGGAVMALLFILLVIAGGMGLSVEAGLLGPLASQGGGSVGNHEHLWDWRSVNLFSDALFQPA